MKKIFFLLMLICNMAVSQNAFWSEPMLLTDTTSNNLNADYLYRYDGGNEEEYVFWEKSWDTTATGLYMMKLWEAGSAAEVLLKANTHYKNPRLMDFQIMDTIFLVFFEYHFENEVDLYYIKYHKDGFFSEPVPFQQGPGVQQNCDVNFSGEIVWESDDKIKATSFYIEDNRIQYYDPVVLDSGNCSNPAISNQYPYHVIWEKIVNDTSKFYYVNSLAGNNNWSEPILFQMNGENRNPVFANNWESYRNVFWQNKEDSLWNLYYHTFDSYDSSNTLIELMPGCNKTKPSAVFQFIPVDQNLNDFSGIISCEVDSAGYQDIYANQDYIFTWDFVKISETGVTDKNPGTYYGPWLDFYAQFIVIWESYINSHWVLNYTHKYLPVWGGIDDNFSKNIFNLNAVPNPASNDCKITFNELLDEAQLNIFNHLGIIIKRWEISEISGIKSQINWDLLDQHGQKVPPGLYICTLTIGERSESIKIIVN